MHYYYACLNYPVPSSLIQAIYRGYFKGRRGLSSQRARHHITGSPELAMCHMNQVWESTCSTQPKTPTNATNPTSALPHMPSLHIHNHMAKVPQEPINACTRLIFMHTHAINGASSSNQTGWFPITSNWGNTYVVLFYIYNCNYIHSIPFKLLCTYHKIYEWLTLQGFKPLLHKMNNEASHTVENFIQSQQTCLQYTLLDMHCTNPAERAIRTWKNHFLAGIAGLPKSFPITNWCCLTKQCYATLNILSPFCQNPLLSAHEALAGSFSFNATPLAPLGTEVLVCMKPN